MKRYRGYFLYYILPDTKRIKQYSFEGLTAEEVKKLDNQFHNKTFYIFKGVKLNRHE